MIRNNKTNISCYIGLKLLWQIDTERGEIPRSRYMNRLLEYALKEKSISTGNDGDLSP